MGAVGMLQSGLSLHRAVRNVSTYDEGLETPIRCIEQMIAKYCNVTPELELSHSDHFICRRMFCSREAEW